MEFRQRALWSFSAPCSDYDDAAVAAHYCVMEKKRIESYVTEMYYCRRSSSVGGPARLLASALTGREKLGLVVVCLFAVVFHPYYGFGRYNDLVVFYIY